MEYETLQYEYKEETAYLTISRPKALNALNLKVLEELDNCLTDFSSQPLKALIIKGAGDKAFVAGADIKEMSSLTVEQAEAFAKKGQKVFLRLEASPFPVIALIQGFALGGGLELALACDILIMDQEAKIGLPELSLGLIPAFGGTQRLSRAIGFYKAKEMIFTGNFYTAQEAYEMGLINIVVPKEKLMVKAEYYVSLFKKRGPLALAKAKQLIQNSYDTSLIEGLDKESKEFASLFSGKDSYEGMSAFIEKRPAKFSGS